MTYPMEGHDTRISTHAPRTGSDDFSDSAATLIPYFNPRSPHGERQLYELGMLSPTQFQPTLPARGATIPPFHARAQIIISTHAPRTGSDAFVPRIFPRGVISTHAPRTGSDRQRHREGFCRCNFNPRSPHGERLAPLCWRLATRISTHAPRTGSDAEIILDCAYNVDFNPRSPHGERPDLRHHDGGQRPDFNPRSPHGERLYVYDGRGRDINFNPRSPHGERLLADHHGNADAHFNPRSPHGERPFILSITFDRK